MSEDTVEVDARRFEELCEHYSGDLLGQNRCKAVTFADRLWTVTGIASGGTQVPTAQLHELVLPDQFKGPTGSYPFDSDGVFYKGQIVLARGRRFVMSGRELSVTRKGGGAGEVETEPDGQLELLGWRENRKEKKNGRKVLGVRRGRNDLRPAGDGGGSRPRKHGVRTPPKKKRR